MTSHVRKILTVPLCSLLKGRSFLTASLCTGEPWQQWRIDENDELDDVTRARIDSVNYKLRGLIMIRRYNEAIEYWKRYRSDINNTPHSSSTYELLLHIYHSPETIEALRQDMIRLGVVMNDKCGLAYVVSLLKNQNINQVVKFTENEFMLRGSSWFISRVMDLLSERGFPHLALTVGDLFIPTGIIKGEGTEVLASRLRAMGHLGQGDEANELVSKEFNDSNGTPDSIKLSIVDVLSLTNSPQEAFDKLTTIPNYGLQNIAYLLESVHRSGDDGSLASDVYDHTWAKVLENLSINPYHDFGIVSNIKKTYLLRIYNSMISLKLAALRKNIISDRKFFSHNFYVEMRSNHIHPNEETYKIVLMYSCFDDTAFQWVENTIKRFAMIKAVPSAEAMVSWSTEDVCLDCDTVHKMISTIRFHCITTKQTLGVEQFRKILTAIGNNTVRVKTIKILQNMMKDFGILESNCNMILRAYQHTRVLGAVFTFYKDMQEIAAPDIDTFHILLDSVIQDGSHRACDSVIYKTWRILLSFKFPPDVKIINKFIKCCRLANDYTRAFYFLSTMDSYNLIPNTDTLQEMLQICEEMDDDESLKGMQKLAHTLYPEYKLSNRIEN